VVTKDIASVKYLLTVFNIPFTVIGTKKDSLTAKALLQLWYNLRCFLIVKREKIDIMIGSVTVAYLTRLTKCPSLLLDDDDDDVEPLMVKYVHPHISQILSPTALQGMRSCKDTIYYSGYHELAYLHPNRFKPDASIFEEIGLKEGEPFFVLRFNVFKAHHDIGVQGLSIENKRKLIAYLEKKGKVFITTERSIDEEFKKYQLLLKPEKVHSLLYYATMFIGDSQTMTSEAAMLGTPAIRSNSFVGRIAYLEEQEHKYGLTYGFLPEKFEEMKAKIQELLAMPDLKEEWNKRRQVMLKDKIDVSAFYIWFVENYPQSVNIMNENPEFQQQFN
jgi:predicted glycosyltransferase